MKPRKRIRQVSPRQAERLKQYAKTKRQWWLQVCIDRGGTHAPFCDRYFHPTDPCGARAEKTPHHIRGRLGKLLFDTRYWAALCITCHRRVRANPEWARKEGLLAARGDWGRQPNERNPEAWASS